jgi:hypothetical protein
MQPVSAEISATIGTLHAGNGGIHHSLPFGCSDVQIFRFFGITTVDYRLG